jgi:hypothetical protein
MMFNKTVLGVYFFSCSVVDLIQNPNANGGQFRQLLPFSAELFPSALKCNLCILIANMKEFLRMSGIALKAMCLDGQKVHMSLAILLAI